MHMNAPSCTKCSIENAYECQQMHQYQNASYMNAYKCNNMQYHAAGEKCIWMKCNENVENASECVSMHLNAYGKKQHHFREKTTLIPVVGIFAMLESIGEVVEVHVIIGKGDIKCIAAVDTEEAPDRRLDGNGRCLCGRESVQMRNCSETKAVAVSSMSTTTSIAYSLEPSTRVTSTDRQYAALRLSE